MATATRLPSHSSALRPIAEIPTLDQLLRRDLDYICDSLRDEFAKMSGKKLLITGGAGFLGYYLLQSVLHWNDTRSPGRRIELMVFDNFIRAMPD